MIMHPPAPEAVRPRKDRLHEEFQIWDVCKIKLKEEYSTRIKKKTLNTIKKKKHNTQHEYEEEINPATEKMKHE